jgi:hypothetical protein
VIVGTAAAIINTVVTAATSAAIIITACNVASTRERIVGLIHDKPLRNRLLVLSLLYYYMTKSPKKPASSLVECQICHVHYQLKGIGRHRMACAREHNSGIQQKEFLKKKKDKESKIPRGMFMFFSNKSFVVDRYINNGFISYYDR